MPKGDRNKAQLIQSLFPQVPILSKIFCVSVSALADKMQF
ncbi:hypothetical protein BH720_010345 [Desertifilum tharense IPPAS B-1220]|uniref:Uncharacterized protein n=1 Tax=Desertifilum tharense IPPAS B-1220 TaxID=1781255 RepID=A0ACD5H5A7_9CYAN